MQAKHVLVVADSCYSGSLTRGLAIGSGSSSYYEDIVKRRARTVLTSGGLEPVLDAGGGGHSVFAKAFLDALQTNSGVIDGEGIYHKVYDQVRLNAEQEPGYGNIRLAGHDGGDFLFVQEAVAHARNRPTLLRKWGRSSTALPYSASNGHFGRRILRNGRRARSRSSVPGPPIYSTSAASGPKPAWKCWVDLTTTIRQERGSMPTFVNSSGPKAWVRSVFSTMCDAVDGDGDAVAERFVRRAVGLHARCGRRARP